MQETQGRGFTLVELIVVMALMGIIMTAVYSLYLTHQKQAYSSEEVTEVQQNLRIGIERIGRDLKNAGILIPSGQTAIVSGYANYSTGIRMAVASDTGRYARMTAVPVSASAGLFTVPVETAEAVDLFTSGDSVRIIRPGSGQQPEDRSFAVTTVDRGAATVTIRNDAVVTNPFVAGDMVAVTASYPSTIEYHLVNAGTAVGGFTCPSGHRCLVRSANGTEEVIATNMSALRFSYLLDNGTEVIDPSASLGSVRGVRATLTGQTVNTSLMSGGAKTRSISSVFKIRNRRP